MDKIQFKERVKHGRLDFHPKLTYGFEDPDAAPYFTACGWATKATGEPDVIVTMDELDIDPLTIWGPNEGDKSAKFVMPDRAAEHLGIDVDRAAAFTARSVQIGEFQAQIEAELKGATNG